MEDADRKLGAECRKAADSALAALQWVQDNAERLGAERSSLERQLREARVEANKLATAAERPMCVGVFGPSQAGKSYLISALARPPGGEDLIADFEGLPDGLNFVRDINPQGGEEATGLVTRFTIRKQPTPPGYPVAFRTLSELDVVKILMNTYLSDLNRDEEAPPSAAEIAAVFDSVRPEAKAAPLDKLSIDDFYDLRKYTERYFKGQDLVKALSATFWSELERLGPLLPAPARAKVLSLLWGRHEPFTEIYLTLQAALAALDFAADAYAPIEALRRSGVGPGEDPRLGSIIDVRTLYRLGHEQDDRIEVATTAGRSVNLPRPVVAALVAELRILTHKKPWAFFDHTDLLDFPGARAREIDTAERIFGKPDGAARLFLRGKVAYLFERYCAETELTAMLLCIAPSNQEVRTLPKMVDDWIAGTHGPTPEARGKLETALFFVMTKFDSEFEEAAGKLEPSQRFRTRLNVNLVEFFGRTHDWPHHWHPGQPFKNSYWLRNPNFYAEALIQYDEQRREVALQPNKLKRIEELKQAYLATDLVQRHFAEPERAWNEALSLNDGGVSYLAEQLEPVCNPTIKRRQVSAKLAALIGSLSEVLRPFHISSDLVAEKEKRLAQARSSLESLARCAENERFGEFLHVLQVSDEALADLYFRIAADYAGEAPAESATPSAAPKPSRFLQRLGLQQGGGNGSAESTTASHSKGERRAERFATAAVESWIESMRQETQSESVARRLKAEATALSSIAGEVAQAAGRLRLRDRIVERLQGLSSVPSQPKHAMATNALMAAETINRFVSYLGTAELPPEERPRAPDDAGRERPVFTRQVAVGEVPNLPAERMPFNDQTVVDWMASYLHLVEQNAATLEGAEIDLEQNSRLGKVLGELNQVRSQVA